MLNPNTDTPVWLITGCSKGLGRALAVHVLAQGHRCVVTARDLDSIRELISAHPDHQAAACAVDVTDPDQVARAVRLATDRFGRIDALVNNAGFGYNASVEAGKDKQIRDLFETNFFGLASLTRAVLPFMRAQRSGHIFNVSSISGRVGSPGSAYYAASKFAVEGLSQGLAKEVGPLGIRVTIIEPGPLRTDFQGSSMTSAPDSVDDYAQTVGLRHERLRATHGHQEGSPARAAEMIFRVFQDAAPPLQLLMGKRAIEMADVRLHEQFAELNRHRQTSLSVDVDS
jgi:NAD(P)-dependent dehydrogenase (short-subunit alcohol dehydrogenase family)